MLRFLHNPFGFLMLAVALLTACGTTQINSAWKDPTYQARPSKIMVVGVSKSQLKRRMFEDEFVRQLKAHGVQGIASYTVLPDRYQNNHEIIADGLVELGADTVLVTRLVSKKTVQTYVPGTPYIPPPYFATWQDYYLYGYQSMSTPGYMTEDEYAVLETNLYEAGSNRLVWAASSETVLGGSDRQLIRSYVSAMVDSMAAQGLLGK